MLLELRYGDLQQSKCSMSVCIQHPVGQGSHTSSSRVLDVIYNMHRKLTFTYFFSLKKKQHIFLLVFFEDPKCIHGNFIYFKGGAREGVLAMPLHLRILQNDKTEQLVQLVQHD